MVHFWPFGFVFQFGGLLTQGQDLLLHAYYFFLLLADYHLERTVFRKEQFLSFLL